MLAADNTLTKKKKKKKIGFALSSLTAFALFQAKKN